MRRRETRNHTTDEAAVQAHVRDLAHKGDESEAQRGRRADRPDRSPPDGGTAERERGERMNPSPSKVLEGDAEPIEPERSEERD